MWAAASAWPAPLKEAEAAYRNRDYTKAEKLFRPAANRGEPLAQYRIGEMYNLGQGVPKDYAEAVKWYAKAADQNYTQAELNLGVLYYNGQGVPLDYIAALKLFLKAARRGDAAAQFSVGNVFYNGDGVTKDFAVAARWYLKAAEQGHSNAQHNLGFMYSQGQGVPKDQDKAALWYRKAKVKRSESPATGDLDKEFESFTRKEPLDPAVKARLADAYCLRGSDHKNAQRTPDAIADFEKSLKIGATTDDCEPYNPLIGLYTQEARYDKAWALVRKRKKSGGYLEPTLVEELKRRSGGTDQAERHPK